MATEQNLIWVTNTQSSVIKSGMVGITRGFLGAPQSGQRSEEELRATGYVGIYKRAGDRGFKIEGENPYSVTEPWTANDMRRVWARRAQRARFPVPSVPAEPTVA
jgi:hypothetical protein